MIKHVLLGGDLMLLELLLLDPLVNVEEKNDYKRNQCNDSSTDSDHNDELN